MLNRRTLLAGLAALPLTVVALRAAPAEVFATGRIAIGGADPVAYFTAHAPVIGSAEFGLMWRGATWLFASADTMEAFEMDPQRFCPAYGGHCAHAMADGAIASTVPEAFAIHQDRLYLTHNLAVRALWQADMPGFIARADRLWPALLHG